MRVLVTGANGFVGTAVVKELLLAGHQVLGLARSDKTAEQLKDQGIEVLRGSLEDIEVLRKGASECDAVIHLAFVRGFENFAANCETDRAAITAMGSALAAAGGERSLVITSGTMMLPLGKKGDEDDEGDMSNPMTALRAASEPVCLDFAKQGVRASVVRLPPTTHGAGGVSGFMGPLTGIALQKGISAYVGEGNNHWCACHREDAATLYRLAIEKAKPGSVFHAVAEEGVLVKNIAMEIGKQLDIPVVSIPQEKVAEHFGWFQFGPAADNIASATKTRERLGWEPKGLTVIEDVPNVIEYLKDQPPDFFKSYE